ncbi:tRNA (guanosine(46)-N7)-methyltransferase TrmB [Sporosarcina sp. G11-34]|uniref:tRNA (guanosine(46)-N7)-methyltransferase TrmB n=1 Tax=Sporosarcina sp. G11-34 TaxID=2849605 RepID=UPI0022A9AE5A|nr:tRNA (guanosine(46)-N7)-methyltransferase TrmB [Sporosarcina sp. G11-34]MCZ2257941.1 tRNA (guanosine(46)-N7)-methyltransferase TrmB [Sporosarcina sp. G11-34]
MRLRNKPWARDYMSEHPDVLVAEPEKMNNGWNKLFGNDNPIHIEVGTGMGQFIIGMAIANPDVNYIGIEHFDNVIVVALEKAIEADKPSNLKLFRANGVDLLNIFHKGEIDRVYLNFSDPWPKTRHEKRRLTSEMFLELYESVLRPGGEIHFKTDNRSLFEYSLVTMSQYNMKLNYVSLDLHKENLEDNIMTEYEEKFSSKGYPIYRLEAQYGEQ